MKKVINKGKEVKPVKNIKNLQSFLEMQKEVLPLLTARPCMYQNPLELKEESLTEKLPESTESSKFVSHRARVSGEFDSKKDSHSSKFKQNSNEIQIYLVYFL